jgi:hypothetical protein
MTFARTCPPARSSPYFVLGVYAGESLSQGQTFKRPYALIRLTNFDSAQPTAIFHNLMEYNWSMR